jgi:hypothetical protein
MTILDDLVIIFNFRANLVTRKFFITVETVAGCSLFHAIL